MNKGTIIGLIIAIIVIIAGVVGFAIYRNSSTESNNQVSNSNTQRSTELANINEENTSTSENNEENNNTTTSNNSKILVVYYSAQTHTRKVAERIANNFTGKTVIPFCTSYSSGIGQSDKLLKNEAKGGDWKSGQRFYQDVDLSEVDKWTNGLGL